MPTPSSDDMVKALVADAMLKALDEQKREQLIRYALEALITAPRRGSYGDTGPTELQTAFTLAISGMAREMVKEMLATDEVKVRVRDLVAKAFEKMVLDEERIVTRMADAFVSALADR